MSHEVKLGEILHGQNFRDAIHIAVAPVIAGEEMNPGDHIEFYGGKAYRSYSDTIGIVDPFLKGAVNRGESFYMFLYPNTITSLRHEWTHPAFVENPPTPSYEEDDDYSCPC